MKRVLLWITVIFVVAAAPLVWGQQRGTTPLSSQDKTFIQDMTEGGMFEVRAAKMAEQKAASPQVKDYARRLQQDHAKADQELRRFAQSNDLQLPQKLGGAYQQRLDKLSGLSGQDFDREFLKIQLEDHKDDILKSQKEVNAGNNPDLIQFARKNQVVLEQHMETAQNLSGTMSSTRTQKSASARQE